MTIHFESTMCWQRTAGLVVATAAVIWMAYAWLFLLDINIDNVPALAANITLIIAAYTWFVFAGGLLVATSTKEVILATAGYAAFGTPMFVLIIMAFEPRLIW